MQTLAARTFVMLLIFGLAAPAAGAATPGAPAQAERSGPLANLPSAPGPHLQKIKNLAAGDWLNLGQPEGDPKWGKARGRAWGCKAFALAPDIRGAYFTGEGRHGFVKPDGFGMDDYWVYDINANRWICLFPGTDVKNLNRQVKDGELKYNENGLVVDRNGDVVLCHRLIHAWGWLAYDTDRKKFMIGGEGGSGFGSYYVPGGKAVEEGLAELHAQRKGKKFPDLAPVCYDTASGKFECFPAKKGYPGRTAMSGFPQFLYIPTQKKCIMIGGGKVAWYDPDERAWSMAKTTDQAPRGSEIAGCYDSKRDRVYMGAGIGVQKSEKGKDATVPLLIYDIKSATWSSANEKGEYPNNWSNNYSMMHYDTANDKVVVMHGSRIFVYDPKADAWAEPTALPQGVRTDHGFYDPELNAHFLYVAKDSAEGGVMWAFRLGKGD